MLRTLVKAVVCSIVCSIGFHDWNDSNRCTRCRRVGCLVGRHDWKETNRQVVVSPRPYPKGRGSDGGHFGLVVTTATKLFYECTICGASTNVSRVEEGYAGRA